jgi:hypothetical protein
MGVSEAVFPQGYPPEDASSDARLHGFYAPVWGNLDGRCVLDARRRENPGQSSQVSKVYPHTHLHNAAGEHGFAVHNRTVPYA